MTMPCLWLVVYEIDTQYSFKAFLHLYVYADTYDEAILEANKYCPIQPIPVMSLQSCVLIVTD